MTARQPYLESARRFVVGGAGKKLPPPPAPEHLDDLVTANDVATAPTTPDAWEALNQSPQAAEWKKENHVLLTRLERGAALIESGNHPGHTRAELVALWADLWLEYLRLRWRIAADVGKHDEDTYTEGWATTLMQETFRVVGRIDPPATPTAELDGVTDVAELRRLCAGMVRLSAGWRYGEGA